MADSSFGLKIGLEGEREFKRAITEINREMRVLGSEMKLAASAFAKNETSVGSLTAKNQVLAKEIDAQRQKVETLRAALDNAAFSFGENDSRTKNWQIQLNNAQATLNGLEAELEDNNDALKQFGSQADGAGDDAKDAANQTGRLEDAVDDLGGELDDTSGKTRIFGDVLKANLASEAIIAGVKGIVNAVAGVARGFAGAMKDGVEYNARMEQYTTSFTTMLGDQAKAQQLVNDLKREAARTPFGMEDLAKNTQTLMAFGMSAEEAQLRLGQLGDISQGDAVKLESLTLAFAQMSSTGKLTGQDLNQMINAGFNPLEEISRKTGKSIGELKEEMGKGAISAEMVADAFASATAEGGRFYGAMDAQSQTFSGQLATLEDGVANLKGVLAGGLSQALAGTVLPMVNGWVDELTAAFEEGGAPALIETFGQILQEALAFIAEQLPAVIETGMSILTALIEGIIEVLPSLAETAVQLVTALLEAIIEALPLLLDAALQVIATLATGIGEALPELIPAAIEMLTALVQGLIDNLPMLLDAALQLITGLTQGLLEALPVLIEALPQIVTGIVEFLIGAIPQLIETGITLLTSLVGALPEIITAIVTVLPQIITGITTTLLAALPQLVQAGVQLLTALIQNLPTIISTIVAALPQIISAIVSAIGGAIPQLVQAGVQLFTALIQNLPQIISTIVAAVPQIITGIVNAVGQGVGQMASAGVDLVRGLWNGIQSLAGWLWDQVAGWCSDIWDGITGFFGINSPSKEMAWVGDMLTRGLAGGITTTGQRAITAAQDVAKDTLGAMNTLTEGITVPIATDIEPVRVPEIDLAPVSVNAQHSTQPDGTNDRVDVAGIIDHTARRLLESLDIKVVLNDGTLVGKLAPGLNRQLARLSSHQGVLVGGGV
ncbi:phage tail protein [Corynebacterium silvaticum]|uniref:phage tail protein n=1 Tax=Corynebacterium silvaticum TaxID=2320431 RepID=UPI001068A6E1|nr:tape measure protein [Corynebacterium silvaticum]MBH5299844.1 tape measure protein [Corynebacterium silvaticum]NOM65737.1 tape measure protein [Corynebacterium silvaticum]TFA91551.1 phage tail protein [Corynebacterium silvaticum]TFA92587.1 phage tail protein [Corynebacterium silvaticum]TNX78728.1 tape measure protein [Corynebacterium silvaticum]